MPRTAWIIGLLLLAAGAAPSALAQQPDRPVTRLTITADPAGTALSTLKGSPATGTDTARIVAYLGTSGDKVTGVRLAATIDGGALAMVAVDGNVTESVDVEPGTPVRVVIEISALTQARTYLGELRAIAAGTPRSLAPIVVEVAATEPLLVEGASETGITMATETEDARRTVRIVSTAGVDLNDLRVDVPALRGAVGLEVPVTVHRDGALVDKDTVLSVAAGDTLALVVEARLPESGTYIGSITLTYAGRRRPAVQLQATRSQKTTTIIGDEVGPIDAVVWGRRRSVEVQVHLLETGGRSSTLGPPTLARVLRKNGTRQTEAPDVVVGKAAGASFGPNDPRSVEVQLKGFDRPGEYTGKLRFPSDVGPTLDVPFTVSVRRPLLFAAIVIALGVAISEWLRRSREKQVGQESQLKIARLQTRFDGTVGSREPLAPDVVASFRNAIRSLSGDVADDPALSVIERVAAFEVSRILLHRWLDATGEFALGVPPGLIRPADWAVVRVWFLGPLDTKPSADVQKAIDSVEASLRSQQRLRPSITILREAIERWRVENPAAADKTDDITAKLEDAVAKALAGDDPGAEAAYLAGTVLWRRLNAAVLRERAHKAAPEGVDASKWNAARQVADEAEDAILASNDPIQVEKWFAAAVGQVVGAQADSMRAFVDKAVAATATLADKLNPLSRRFGEIAAQADADPYGAASNFDEAQADLAALRVGKVETVPDRLPLLALGSPGMAGPPPSPPAPLDTEADARARLRRTRAGRIFVAGLVAVGIGIQTLYLANATWGSPIDVIAALLWGIGLSQATYGGMAAWTDTLGKKPA